MNLQIDSHRAGTLLRRKISRSWWIINLHFCDSIFKHPAYYNYASFVPRPLLACNIEKLGVTYGQGYNYATIVYTILQCHYYDIVYVWAIPIYRIYWLYDIPKCDGSLFFFCQMKIEPLIPDNITYMSWYWQTCSCCIASVATWRSCANFILSTELWFSCLCNARHCVGINVYM